MAATKNKKGEKSASGTVTVEQTGSPIRRPKEQRATLQGLGLNRMHRRSTLEDTPAVRGMIAKVAHMVKVVDPPERRIAADTGYRRQSEPPRHCRADMIGST